MKNKNQKINLFKIFMNLIRNSKTIKQDYRDKLKISNYL